MITIDPKSLLADVSADTTLDAIETDLAARAMTLGLDKEALDAHAKTPLGEWLAKGAPGAACSLADPADHLVAGMEATLPNGKKLEVRPGPRRAVGPDLVALALGTGGRLARIDRVWLRVHLREARRPSLGVPALDLDPPLSAAESRLVDAIAAELERS